VRFLLFTLSLVFGVFLFFVTLFFVFITAFERAFFIRLAVMFF